MNIVINLLGIWRWNSIR